MSLLTTLLASTGGGGGGGSVPGTILTPVVCASTVAFTVTYANGTSGIGATLTNAGAQAAISMDGISPTVGQRVLIKNQASALQNGIYVVATVGTGATNWVLTRSTDFDEPSEMTLGVTVEVASGTVQAATFWALTASVAAVGTNNVNFSSINVSYKISQSGAEIYAADAGANDTYVITLSPVPSAYTTGMVINFKANTVNTGTATINVNSLGAKTIVKNFNQTLADGDIAAGQFVTLIYDGTNFEMQSQTANASGGGGLTVVNQNSSTVTMTKSMDYFINNGASLVTLTMPATTAQGDQFSITGNSSGKWTIQLVGSQVINTGIASTTAAGTLTAGTQYDCAIIKCVTANTLFVVAYGYGTFTAA